MALRIGSPQEILAATEIPAAERPKKMAHGFRCGNRTPPRTLAPQRGARPRDTLRGHTRVHRELPVDLLPQHRGAHRAGFAERSLWD